MQEKVARKIKEMAAKLRENKKDPTNRFHVNRASLIPKEYYGAKK